MDISLKETKTLEMENEVLKEESQSDLIEPTIPADKIHYVLSQPSEPSIINISPINSVHVLSLPHRVDTVSFKKFVTIFS